MIDGKYTQVTFTNGTAIVNNKTYYETPKVENQYYQISTLNDLYWLVDFVNNGGCKNNKIQVKLVNDITIQQVYSNGSLLTGLKEWIPIGNINNQFSGLFEGQKHTIKGIYINNTNATYLGLFGFCDNAIIRDLNISDSYINGKSAVGSICGRLGSSNKNKIQNCVNYATIKGDYNAGGVCGEAINTTIDKCKNYGKISVTTNNCGGIVAQCASSTITNCENYGQINAQNSSVAGICAHMSVPPNVTDMVNNISNCINYGIINGNESAGGLVSYMNYANMNNCFNYETITSKKCSGGICSETENSIIDKCANIGHIICSEKCYAGGLFGVSIDSKTSNCYNLVDIDTKNQGYCVGGLIGKIQRGTLTNSYSIGNINGNSSYWLGSLCGSNDNATITNCYYNNDNKFKAIYNADDATNKVVGISFLDLFGKISGFDNTIWNDGYLKDITSNSFVGYLPSLKPIEGEITPADTSFKFSYQLENYTSVYMLGSEFKPDGNLKITSTDRSISLKIDATKASYTSPDLSVVNNEIPVNVKYYDAFDLVYKIAVRKTNVKSITLLENSIPNPLIGYDLNLSNAKIKVEYYDSQNDKTIPVTADMVSNYDKSQVGNQLIRISYDGYDSYWDIEVIEIKPIQITFQESSINKVLFVGDEIDLSSSELLVDYNDFRETEKIKITKDMLSGFNNKKAGTQFVTITYQGLKTTFSIEVRAIEIISIVIEDNSFAKSMIVGDDLDLSNAKLNVCYNKSENNQTIPITSRMIVGFDKSKVGYQDIVVSYGGLKTSKSIYINSCTYRVVFEWDNNYSSVKAYAKCLENSNKNIDLVCSTIEKKETPATETEKGKIVYSTSAIFKYNKYTSVKEVEIPKLGKTIKDEEPTFNWDGINSASASFITEDGDVFEIPEEKISSKITKAPTADTDGEIEYSATFTYDGKEYTSTKIVTIPKLSSEYKLGDYIYTWDKEKPIIVFENNDSEFVAQEGKVIKEIINQQASLELEGKKTITIEYEINGTDYYKDIEIILPKLTPTANNIVNQISAKVWGYNNIIYINIDNNVYAKIFDINGHLIKSVLLNNSYNEIPMNKNGVYIVVIDNKSYKVSLF
ncbi:MAG: bacterial Ig-like domain-containing protein [Bacteroidales bacterium]|nr:bacterial Ig-like domain-containing protein [Bacteroidales bacterium]